MKCPTYDAANITGCTWLQRMHPSFLPVNTAAIHVGYKRQQELLGRKVEDICTFDSGCDAGVLTGHLHNLHAHTFHLYPFQCCRICTNGCDDGVDVLDLDGPKDCHPLDFGAVRHNDYVTG